MKIRKITIPEFLISLICISLFLPGTIKTFLVLTLFSIAYSLTIRRCIVSKVYTILVVYIVLLGIFSIIDSGDSEGISQMILIFILPFLGVKLQAANARRIHSYSERRRRHMITLIIVYAIYVVRILLATPDGGFRVTGMMFHSSTLALIGTLIALEIFRDDRNRVMTVVGLTLLMMPIVGGLRQYVFIFIPIMVVIVLDNRLRRRSIVASIIIALLMFATPIGSRFQMLRADTASKGSTLNQYFAAATNPEEGTINQRTVWWQNAIEATVSNNFLFGHALTYKFIPIGTEYRSSGMLHSYFVGAFADGGIILFLLTALIFLKNIRLAFMNKDKYTILAIIAFVVVFASNGTATTTQKAFLIFYIYGFYELEALHYNRLGDKNAVHVTQGEEGSSYRRDRLSW